MEQWKELFEDQFLSRPEMKLAVDKNDFLESQGFGQGANPCHDSLAAWLRELSLALLRESVCTNYPQLI